MSVKEFFAFANIKQTVIEYLKNKSDYETLSDKYKKPFRAHINKHQGGIQGGGGLDMITTELQQHQMQTSSTSYADYFVSDGFHSIKCQFSEVCRESFERAYPTSIRIFNIVNMLICVQSYFVELRCPNNNMAAGLATPVNLFKGSNAASDLRSLKNLEVVLVIDELRVISFDRFGMKMPSSVAFDDQVRVHLSYLRHFLMKQVLLKQEFSMTMIGNIPLRLARAANEERSSYCPTNKFATGRFEQGNNNFSSHRNAMANSAEKPKKGGTLADSVDFDPSSVI